VLLASRALAAPVKLIIDTDIGGGGCNDVDDVVALAVGHALMDRGEAEILAVLLNTAPVECAGAIGVLNHYYGRDAVLIGAYDVRTPGATLEMEEPLPYVKELVRQFPSPVKNSSQVEDAVAVYRRVLASQPDRSVTISSIGIHSNLAALLRSGADGHSALSGRELAARKVALLAVMGGEYPTSAGKPECNLCGGSRNRHNDGVASAASSYVAAHWPPESRILWSGFGIGLQVESGGAGFQRCRGVHPSTSPVAAAMVSYMGGPGKSRSSWDPLTTLAAVRGAAGVSCTECTDCDGVNTVDQRTGSNVWARGPRSNQTYLVLHDAKRAGAVIDELLCAIPRRLRSPLLWL